VFGTLLIWYLGFSVFWYSGSSTPYVRFIGSINFIPILLRRERHARHDPQAFDDDMSSTCVCIHAPFRPRRVVYTHNTQHTTHNTQHTHTHSRYCAPLEPGEQLCSEEGGGGVSKSAGWRGRTQVRRRMQLALPERGEINPKPLTLNALYHRGAS